MGLEGRIMNVGVIVNVPGGKEDSARVVKEGLKKVKSVLKSASNAPYGED